MPSQKLETILNLSLSSTPEQRARSGVLDVGYDAEENTWELIVKYSGNLDEIRRAGIGVEELLAGYAIMTVPESLIDTLTAFYQIEYVEMPKNLLDTLYAAKQKSCILPLTGSSAEDLSGGPLTGEGILIAVLDSGIDYYLPDFRNEDGTTRIAWLWDQTLDAGVLNERAAVSGNATVPDGATERFEDPYAPPQGFAIGVEFSESRINAALAAGIREAAFNQIPSIDRSGHGTEVAAVAAGNNASPRLRGVAIKATLLIVKLANLQTGFPRTTELMRGVQWAIQKARDMGMPLVINLSFGNSYGPHEPCNQGKMKENTVIPAVVGNQCFLIYV